MLKKKRKVDTEEEKDNYSSKWKWILWAVLLIWIAVSFSVFQVFDDWSSRGQFRDMFGAVNALFSGFAFAGVLIAILLQREELKLQREELKMTREELKRSAEAQEKSEEALRRQAASLKITARLNAMTQLLNHYQEEIDLMKKQNFRSNPEKVKNFERARSMKKCLLDDLSEIYESKEFL